MCLVGSAVVVVVFVLSNTVFLSLSGEKGDRVDGLGNEGDRAGGFEGITG